MATSTIKTDTRHSLGTAVNITENNVTIQKDGYFEISCDYKRDNYVIGYVNNSRMISVSTMQTVDATTYLNTSCYVKKGMTLKAVSNDFTNSSNHAEFIPLE